MIVTVSTENLRVGQKARRFKSQDFSPIASIDFSPVTLERARVVFNDGTSAETGWAAAWEVLTVACESCGAPCDALGHCLGSCQGEDWDR